MGIPVQWGAGRDRRHPSPSASSSSMASSTSAALETIVSKPIGNAPSSTTYDAPHRAELKRVKGYFATKTQTEVLMYCMGLLRFEDAPPLAKSTIVICFDTEGWNADSSIITEVGFCTFESKTMRTMEPGPFGENVLKNTFFYHIRVSENAHLKNLNAAAGDPDHNRFGKTRFLTKTTTKLCLEDAFQWPVDPDDLSKGVCPVVMLGHALENDQKKLEDLLSFEPDSHGQLVKEVDTQVIARELNYWTTPNNQTGLRHLVTKLGFEYRDAHTASNDAAMTLIAAVLLVLPGWYYINQPVSLQDIVDEVEKLSKTRAFNYGSSEYCFRCQQDDHMEEYPDGSKPRCNAPVLCTLCEKANDPRRKRSMYCHLANVCIWHGLDNGNSRIAQARKEAKRREINQATLTGVTSELAGLSVNGHGSRARKQGDRGRGTAVSDVHAGQGRAQHLARGGAVGFLSRGAYIPGVSGRPGYPRSINGGRGRLGGRGGHLSGGRGCW